MPLRLLLAISATSLLGCGSKMGRYREITNNPHPACGPNNTSGASTDPFLFGCGIAILDTETGTVYLRRQNAWSQEQPQTGQVSTTDLKVK
jgi:hypothetical protein